MTRGDQLRIDTAQPLDLTHRLLRNVEGFWGTPSGVGITRGSRLYDLSPHKRHGEVLNGVWDNGAFGPELFVDNKTTAPNVPANIDGVSALSVAFAFKTTHSEGGILSWDEDESFAEMGFSAGGLFNNSSGGDTLIWRVGTSGGVKDTEWVFPENEWVTVVGTFKANSQSRLFTNGILRDSTSVSAKANQKETLHLGVWRREDDTKASLNIIPPLLAFRVWSGRDAKAWDRQVRRGFPNLFNRRGL